MDFDSFLNSSDAKLYFVFCDDGSTDSTWKLLNDKFSRSKQCKIFRSDKNLGKGNIIQFGYQNLADSLNLQTTDWIGFWDADLSTPLSEVYNFFSYANIGEREVSAIFGSRIYMLGTRIERLAYRHYISRVVASLLYLFFRIDTYDSQCGAKLFSYPAADIAFSRKFKTRWLFDVEIILRLKDFKIIEYPLRKWVSRPGSKLGIIEVFRVVWELFYLLITKPKN